MTINLQQYGAKCVRLIMPVQHSPPSLKGAAAEKRRKGESNMEYKETQIQETT